MLETPWCATPCPLRTKASIPQLLVVLATDSWQLSPLPGIPPLLKESCLLQVMVLLPEESGIANIQWLLVKGYRDLAPLSQFQIFLKSLLMLRAPLEIYGGPLCDGFTVQSLPLPNLISLTPDLFLKPLPNFLNTNLYLRVRFLGDSICDIQMFRNKQYLGH